MNGRSCHDGAHHDRRATLAAVHEYSRAVPLDEVAVTPLDPTRFRDVLSPQGLAQFEHAVARGRELLEARIFWNVNSTAHGGGVAEMLRSLIGYVRGVGVDGSVSCGRGK